MTRDNYYRKKKSREVKRMSMDTMDVAESP